MTNKIALNNRLKFGYIKMRLSIFLLPLSIGCSAAIAYDVPEQKECVIDRCNDKICSVETPEGWVEVSRRHNYYEGKRIVCPTWLVEPT